VEIRGEKKSLFGYLLYSLSLSLPFLIYFSFLVIFKVAEWNR